MTREDVEMFYKQAITYLGEKDIKKAIEFFNRALEIDEKILGPEHQNVAAILNGQANLYCQMEDYEKVIYY